MTPLEHYLLTYNAAKAAWRAYTASPNAQLFELGIQASNEFQEARMRFLAVLNHTGGTPPDPETATQGVSQTHCIK